MSLAVRFVLYGTIPYLVGVRKPSAGAGLPDVHLSLAAGGQDTTVPLFPHDRSVAHKYGMRHQIVTVKNEWEGRTDGVGNLE